MGGSSSGWPLHMQHVKAACEALLQVTPRLFACSAEIGVSALNVYLIQPSCCAKACSSICLRSEVPPPCLQRPVQNEGVPQHCWRRVANRFPGKPVPSREGMWYLSGCHALHMAPCIGSVMKHGAAAANSCAPRALNPGPVPGTCRVCMGWSPLMPTRPGDQASSASRVWCSLAAS